MQIRALLVAALAVTAFTAGCEEEVLPVLGTDEPYSVYGLFTPQLDTQWVRVFPVQGQLEPALPEPLDARVTSVDLMTGETRVWSDSLLQERTGQYTHVFWSPFTAEYGHAYQLTVERSDGLQSQAEVTVPPQTTVALGPEQIPWPVRVPVHIRGGAPRLNTVTLTYQIIADFGGGSSTEFTLTFPVVEDLRRDGLDWVIPINLAIEFEGIVGRLEALGLLDGFDDTFRIQLLNMTLRCRVVNEEWVPPDGTLDPEVLVQPELLQNVENGFGFVGAGYLTVLEWLPSPEALEAARFYVPPEEEGEEE